MSPVSLAEVKQRTQAAALVLGADMQQLWQRFPPRTPPSRWPATEGDRDQVLARLLAPPFTVDAADAQERRRRGLMSVVNWLADQPGATWQQRWLASGAEALGNADWWRPWLGHLQSGSQRRGQSVTVTSNLRVCLLLLVCAEVIRPGVGWLLTPRAPQSLVTELARTRDPDGFAELAALCDASPTGRTMTMSAMRRVATIVAVKGGTVRDITVGDCLELSLTLDGDTRRKNKGLGFYQLLHQMGVFAPHAPSTLRAFATQGQLSPAQMLEPYGIQCVPIRELILAYLHERRPTLDHTTLRSLAFTLGRLFWRDLEIHHAGINSLNLTAEVAAAWKQRVLTRTIRTTGPRRSDRRGAPASRRRPQPAHPGPGLLPRPGPVGDGRTDPMGAVGRPVPGAPGRPGPHQGIAPTQVPHGPTHPRTPASPTRPTRSGPRRARGQRRAAERGPGRHPRGHIHRRRAAAPSSGDQQRTRRPGLGRRPRHRHTPGPHRPGR